MLKIEEMRTKQLALQQQLASLQDANASLSEELTERNSEISALEQQEAEVFRAKEYHAMFREKY